MKHLKSTFGGLLALTAAASNAFAQGPPPPPIQRRTHSAAGTALGGPL